MGLNAAKKPAMIPKKMHRRITECSLPVLVVALAGAVITCSDSRSQIVGAGGNGGDSTPGANGGTSGAAGYEAGAGGNFGTGTGGARSGGTSGTGAIGSPDGGNQTGGTGRAFTLDAGSADAPVAATPPLRLVVLVTRLGMYRDALKVSFPETSDAAGWTRSLSDKGVTLSPILTPLASFRERLVVIDGMTQHVAMNDGQNGCFSVPPESNSTAALTGDFLCRGTTAQDPVAPSLDWLIGEANHSELGLPLLTVATGLVSRDRRRTFLLASTPREAYASLFPAGAKDRCNPGAAPAPTPKTADAMATLATLVTTAFACDRNRVVTIGVSPTAAELGLAGDLEQDFANRLDVSSGTVPPKDLVDGFVRFNAFATEQVARFARSLASAPEGGGSLLDRTVILWISTDATPGYGYQPWNAVVLAGSRTGISTGRYIRVPQDTVTSVPFVSGTTLRGTSHNHFLVSMARWFGLNVNSVGAASVQQKNDAPTLDLSGPLPGL